MKIKYINKKASISYLQILILLTATFAIPYLFFQSTETVDAANYGKICCEETKQGNTCQNAISEECNPEFRTSPSSCEITEFCEIGCCVSPETGLCSSRSSKRDCEKQNGTFEPEQLCQINECEKGCCILGTETKWTTEKNCEFEGNSENNDIPTEWLTDSAHDSDIECKFASKKNSKGACVYDSGDEKKCSYISLEECVARTGSEANFFRDYFCSNPELNTTCQAKDHKGCVENEEDVYWFDSCNNHEDVAEDCSLLNDNYCGKVNDKYTCKSTDCEEIGRKNGESWCEYDGIIGNGKDPAGSRHIRHICYMGTERIEPCADFRNEICVEESTPIKGSSFSQAACRVNQWRVCLDTNREKSADKIKSKCSKNPDCRVKSIDMGGSFSFTVCLPAYPPGFELNPELLNEDGSLNEQSYNSITPSESICQTATKRCTTTWLVGLFCPGCVDNCDCHTTKYTTEMNDFCVSLGDCGGYINYKGEYTDAGYSVKSSGGGTPGRISGNFPNTYQGIPAKIGNFEFYETLNPELLRKVDDGESGSNLSSFEKELMAVAGAYGSPLLLRMLEEGDDNESKWVSGVTSSGMQEVSFARYTGSFSNALNLAIQSQMIPYQAKEQGDYSMIAAMIAGTVAYLITQSIMMTMIAALLAFLMFMPCIIVTYNIDFMCSPWEPPEGGASCNECNVIDEPCSDYRCESLGQLCHFINKGTDNELCVSRPADESFPIINPLESVITEGYEYYNVKDNGFEIANSADHECIDAYQTVRFGITVEPFARCRIGIEPTDDYVDMTDMFGPKGNNLLPIHRMDLFFPSPDAFKNQYNLTEESLEKLGKIEYYVKCKTASGKVNPETYTIKSCVKPGPDLTAPIINELAEPKNGAYVKFGVDEQLVKLYVNEPAECKWDTKDKSYDQMENELNCETDIAKYTLYGLPCNTTLTNLQNNTKFYVKCKDQPWYKGTEESKRNTMEESYVYQLFLSKEPLYIDNFVPEEDEVITQGFEPVSTTLKISTAGGAEKGKSECYYQFDEGSSIRFFETNASVHKQELSSLMSGYYNLKFTCEDAAGNNATNSTRFKVLVDNFGPKIVRAYYDSGLKIVTNEEAECRYDNDVYFIYDNATLMYTADGLEHFGDWESKNYYIQCKDEYENKGAKLKIKPYDIF